MDRDVAQLLLTKINAIKTGLQKLATNSAPAAPESRSVPLTIEDQRRTDPEEVPEEVPEEEPETVPETTTWKRTTSK